MLKHLPTDLGKINFPTKINYRIKLHLETEMKRLFKSRKFGDSSSNAGCKNYIYQSGLHSV